MLLTWGCLYEKQHFLFSNGLKKLPFKKSCTGIWSFLYYQQRQYFFFPKIWPYSLYRKWKIIFPKKCMKTWYFLIFGEGGIPFLLQILYYLSVEKVKITSARQNTLKDGKYGISFDRKIKEDKKVDL